MARLNINEHNIDEIEIHKIQNKVDVNSKLIDEIVNRLVLKYCNELDTYMHKIKIILQDEINPPKDLELENFVLSLPVLLYFTSEAQESLGIKEDMSKAIKSEVYNVAYKEASGTVADKTTKAEQESSNEIITYIIYQRAYKKIKLRMEAGYEMLSSVKKVMSKRIVEFELSRTSGGN